MIHNDATKTCGQVAGNWVDNLEPGDVVLFADYPRYGDSDELPEPSPHLVFSKHFIEDSTFAILTTGTSISSPEQRPIDIHVAQAQAQALNAAGLTSPTSFNLHDRVIVCGDHEGYCLQPTGTAVIGKLAGEQLARLQAYRTQDRIQTNWKSCQWAAQHLFPRDASDLKAKRKWIIPIPYAVSEMAQSSTEI
ncbi:hypothetical protein FDK21_11745 [Cohaesibacter sp. CAU 1516]|uniref:hypothetical protein n=1 Tax=Cohaesibacter sp. CAU 1516 TaxID=2576038 RepID=UPI0010FE2C0C|nr:hypothetical protein [Cohaesibacter sp. CAU 1516]TLP45429.1 hypothetical protein FDK21_11745 [Cohaesibacter sp. CAU 1516]